MAKNYTRLTNLEVTDELKAKTLNVDGLTVDGVSDITAPEKAAATTFSKTEFDAVVDAVNGILALMGASDS